MTIAAFAASVWLCASIDANTIRRVFRRHTAQIKHCYDQQLVKDHKLRGRVVVRVTIDGNGRVVVAEISESELIDATTVKVDEWKGEIPLIEEWFEKIGAALPTSLRDELDALRLRLEA